MGTGEPAGRKIEMASLRRRKDRKKPTWVLDYRDPGDGNRRYQIDTGTRDKTLAKTWLAKCEERISRVRFGELEKVGRISREQVGNSEKRSSLNLLDYIDEYTKRGELDLDLKPSTLSLMSYAIKSLAGEVGNRPLEEITQEDIRRWRAAIREGCSKTTESIYGRALDTAFERALKWGYAKSNPLAEFEFSPNEGTNTRKGMSYSDVRKLLKLIEEEGKDRFGQYVRVVLYTGGRRAEALRLRGEDIDLQNRILQMTVTKRRGPSVQIPVPIGTRLMEVFNGMELEDGKYLFETESKSRGASKKGKHWHPSYVTAEFKRIAEKAGLESYTLHSLRHTYVTYLRERGVGYDIIQRLVGHTTSRVTQDVYDHTTAKSYLPFADMVDFEE